MKILNSLLLLIILNLNTKLIKSEASANKKNLLVINIPFETKYIHEIPNDSNEDYYEDYGYDFIDASFSSQDMINEWFYNGIYLSSEIGDRLYNLYLFLDVENSDFTIGRCNKVNTTSFHRMIHNFSYYFSHSSTFSSKEEKNPNNNKIYKIAKDEFTIDRFNLSFLELKFIVNDNIDNINEPLCGNIGLNVIDKSSDYFETNIFRQLKDKELISNYIWTLGYRAEQFGNIILGGEPHFYDGKNYFMSQYKTTYSKIRKNSEFSKISPWSFTFNKVFINKTQKINKEQIVNITDLIDDEAELLIEHGLIIGTEDYKNSIDNIFFNDLFDNKICRRDVVSFYDKVQGINSKYCVYSCEKLAFQGKEIYYQPNYTKPYFNFPSINFFNKDLNYTFTLLNSNLFITKGRVYFLIIFDYENKNKIWKLGEPFLSKFKFVFNPDQKTIGFYNPLLPKIDNDIYIRDNMGNDNEHIYDKEKIINKSYLWYYIGSITIIIILLGIAIYLAKKLHKARKKRANELDDSFDYTEAESPEINAS
jgi:hypothetical protein